LIVLLPLFYQNHEISYSLYVIRGVFNGIAANSIIFLGGMGQWKEVGKKLKYCQCKPSHGEQSEL
jgi:hypothetical protein